MNKCKYYIIIEERGEKRKKREIWKKARKKK